MSRKSGFLHQSSHYSVAQFLLVFSSAISFPILTRIFSPGEYGMMNLISNAIVIVLAVSKGGMQHGIVRFFNEYAAENPQQQAFVSTMLLGGIAIAALVALGWFFANAFFAVYLIDDALMMQLLLLSGVLVFLRAGESMLLAFFRAEQQTIRLNVYRVISKYFTLGLILALLFLYSRSLTTFYSAQIVAMGMALCFLFGWRMRLSHPHPGYFSKKIFSVALIYGFPLIGFELGSVLLNFVDRYLIQYYLGTDAVGYYSAAYNLTDYVKDLVVLPMATAVMPIYMQVWAKNGANATRVFLQKALKSYLLLAIPLVFGCVAIREDLINVVASAKFVQGHVIIPYVIAGMMINGALPILAASVYIRKKTALLIGYLALAIALNIGMNILFIPEWGIQGAAVAKLVSFCILAIFATQYTYKNLEFRIPWQSLLLYAFAGIVMYTVLASIHITNHFMSLLAEIGAGAVIYFGIIFTIDAAVRKQILRYVHRLRR